MKNWKNNWKTVPVEERERIETRTDNSWKKNFKRSRKRYNRSNKRSKWSPREKAVVEQKVQEIEKEFAEVKEDFAEIEAKVEIRGERSATGHRKGTSDRAKSI